MNREFYYMQSVWCSWLSRILYTDKVISSNLVVDYAFVEISVTYRR